MTRGYYAKCANCGRMYATQRDYVRHLLEEAGSNGVTTNEFLRWGAGSRFGARIHELRHEDSLYITEANELYTLRGVAAVPDAEVAPVAGVRLRAADRDGRETTRPRWRCLRCPLDERTTTGPVCARGHKAVLTLLIDTRHNAHSNDNALAEAA